MLPQVGAEVSTWRVVGGGRCETGVAAGWQRGRLEQQERAAGRGPSPTKCWPESRREEEGAWQLQPHTNPPIDWIPPGLRVTSCLGRAGPPGNHNNLVVLDNVSLVWETLWRWLAWGAFSSGRELAGRTTSASHPFSGGGRV